MVMLIGSQERKNKLSNNIANDDTTEIEPCVYNHYDIKKTEKYRNLNKLSISRKLS